MLQYLLISIFISLSLSCSNQEFTTLRQNCDPFIYNTSYSRENFEACIDTYAHVRFCLDSSRVNASSKFEGYACELENGFGYTSNFPYRTYSKAYKNNRVANFSLLPDLAWNFTVFNDHQISREICKMNDKKDNASTINSTNENLRDDSDKMDDLSHDNVFENPDKILITNLRDSMEGNDTDSLSPSPIRDSTINISIIENQMGWTDPAKDLNTDQRKESAAMIAISVTIAIVAILMILISIVLLVNLD